MGTITPLKDRIEKREGNVIQLRRQPRWIQRSLAASKGERFTAVKDATDWRPEPAA